jgi:hypothetical protein
MTAASRILIHLDITKAAPCMLSVRIDFIFGWVLAWAQQFSVKMKMILNFKNININVLNVKEIIPSSNRFIA